MQVEFFQQVSSALSVERLSSYGRQDSADQETILARYLWNLAVCESLYSSVQLCEVIRWSNRDLLEFARTLDRFTMVHSADIEPWKEKIRRNWPAI